MAVQGTRVLVAALLVGLIAGFGRPSGNVSAAASYDWCYNTCGPDTECDVECENDGGGTLTCGEYDGGAENDWCEGGLCELESDCLISGSICYLSENVSDWTCPWDYGYSGTYGPCADECWEVAEIWAWQSALEVCSAENLFNGEPNNFDTYGRVLVEGYLYVYETGGYYGIVYPWHDLDCDYLLQKCEDGLILCWGS